METNLEQIINIEVAFTVALGCLVMVVALVVMIKETWFKKSGK